jgi:uncharacterized protein (TIGR00255 family)
MLKSMTGFGKAVCEYGNKQFTIEIKTLNSKQLDLSTRIPNYYKEKELEIKNLIAKKLERGKVEFTMYFESMGEESRNSLNKDVIKSYFRQFNEISEEYGLEKDMLSLSSMLRFPDVLKIEKVEIQEEEWEIVKGTIKEAIELVNDFRVQEGGNLENDISKRIYNISNLLTEVELYEKARIEKIKNRLRNNLNEFIGEENIDENRFEQELIYYLEKLDITEEKIRLDNHCNYFLENLNEEGAIGKKLGFISQEIGREINTLGSKANDANIQKLVIRMKDELEKIKEQLLNIL